MIKEYYLIDENTQKLTPVKGSELHDGMFVYINEDGNYQIAEESTGLNVGFALDNLDDINKLCDLHVNRLNEFRKTAHYEARVAQFLQARRALEC